MVFIVLNNSSVKKYYHLITWGYISEVASCFKKVKLGYWNKMICLEFKIFQANRKGEDWCNQIRKMMIVIKAVWWIKIHYTLFSLLYKLKHKNQRTKQKLYFLVQVTNQVSIWNNLRYNTLMSFSTFPLVWRQGRINVC